MQTKIEHLSWIIDGLAHQTVTNIKFMIDDILFNTSPYRKSR